MILQIHECTNIRKYSEKGNVKGMNKGIKIRNIKHKRTQKKMKETRKEKEIIVNEKGMVKGKTRHLLISENGGRE